MRIVQIITRRQRRGAEVFATQLSDGLAGRGHEVFVVGLYPAPEDALLPTEATASDLKSTARGRLSFGRIRELAALLRHLRPDVVQANGSDTLKYAVLSRMLLRANWPLVYRNISIASSWLRFPGHRYLGVWLARRINFVSAVSDESRQDFARTYRVSSSRIATIPIGVDIPDELDREAGRRYLIDAAGLPPDAQILIHVGSFSPEKNHLWLLQAFRAIRASDERAYLVLVGTGMLFDEVRGQIEEMGLSQTVRLLGSRADANRLIGGADLLLLPSRIEGLPGVVLEAFAHAVPAVVTDVGSLRDVVHDDATGFVVPLDDLDAFTASTCSLLANREKRLSMGAAARTLVMKRYRIETIVSDFEDLYRRLLSPRVNEPNDSTETADSPPVLT